MGRDRSRSRSRDRYDRDRGRDRRRDDSRERSRRDNDRSRDRGRDGGKSRDRDRRRDDSRERKREKERERERYREDSRERRRRRRSRSQSSGRSASRSRSPKGRSRSPKDRSRSPKDRKRSRSRSPSKDASKLSKLERLEAWKAKQAATTGGGGGGGGVMTETTPGASDMQTEPSGSGLQAAWMPWEAIPDPAIAPETTTMAPKPFSPDPDSPSSSPPPPEPTKPNWIAGYVPAAVHAKKAKLAQVELEEALRAKEAEDEPDPLDAFMSAEVMPEVAAKQAEEARRKEEERQKKLKEMANAVVAGKPIKTIKQLEESESEEEPDLVIQIPTNKVKLMVGPGGSKISEIQKKSKCRIQVKKDETDLNRAFGSGPNFKIPKPGEEPQQKMTTVMIFGDGNHLSRAEEMIMDAIDNREQKQKQRQKEYEKKKEDKRRDRQLYHLRHARDYEALGLPLGASKVDVKKAYRKLALQWHPDKHPEGREEAMAKFQEIQRAYDSLMTTDEDARIEAIAV